MPVAAVLAQHAGLVLVQMYSKPDARIISDCRVVVTGFLKWIAGDPSVLAYQNLYGGGLWAQIMEISADRDEQVVVKEVVEVKAHFTKP